VIEPFNNHRVYTELKIKDFFTSQWDTPFKGPALSAYNNFIADTIEGEEIWWQSLWVTHPESAKGHPYNGAHFLVRYKDGTYEYGDISDDKNPVQKGESLRACRTICKSPFKEDSSAIYYFGGYDAANDTSNNTSWIYKGKILNLNSGISQLNTTHAIKIYPNPVSDYLYISGMTYNNQSVVSIFTILGEEMISRQISGSPCIIQTANLSDGVYFLQLKYKNGQIITKKFIKQ